jgi:hypothetical protein
MAGVLTGFQQFVEPEVRHVIEAKDQQHAEIDERARRTRDDTDDASKTPHPRNPPSP